jgi:hypothetical protein
MASIDLIQAIAATAELCGTNLSEAAAGMLLGDLSEYDERGVLVALTKCRKELKGRLTLAEIISRIDDGRPGAEEAWSMLPRDEATTVVWTDEMNQAWGAVQNLISDGEVVAARMAFKETYSRIVTEAREGRQPARWTVSLGHDVPGRKTALLMAVAKRRLTADHACALIPNFEVEDSVTPLLAAPTSGVIGPTHALTFHPYAQGDN